jgi:PAS domain S-box-containing protein
VERWRQSARSLERQLAAAEQISHIGSWEWDVGGNQLSWSDELYRIYGLEPRSREVTFDLFLSFLHPDDRERVGKHVIDAMNRRGRFQWLERVVRADGEIRDLDTVGEVVLDELGRVTALVGTCRDVTDERRRDESLRRYADICRNVQIGLVVVCAPDADTLGTATLVSANPAAVRALGPALERLGARLDEILPSVVPSELGEALVQVILTGEVRELAEYRFRDAPDPGAIYAVKIFPLPGGCTGLALDDRTSAARARAIQAGEQRILEMVASGATLPSVLTALTREIEELAPPAIASVLLFDEDAGTLAHGAAPGLPPAFTRAIDGAAIGPAAGSCGTAAYRREPVVVEDIAADPLWADWKGVALAHGLRACWSLPIFASDGRVLGTFALYYREPRGAGERDRELIERATHIAGIAMQRRQLDDQLRALSFRIERAREEERTGIAREIHDVLGGSMTALKLDLAWIVRRASGDAGLPTDALVAKVRELMAATDRVIHEVRRISAELRPVELDDLGLVAALEWQALEFERRAQVACTVGTNLGSARLPRDLSTAVFRIFQECLTNVSRHADATHVDVRLVRDGDVLRFEVRDDGRGITPESAGSPRALGLLGIRERARALGGKATISRIGPRGTQVSVELPLGARA